MRVGKTIHNVGGLAYILGLTNLRNQSLSPFQSHTRTHYHQARGQVNLRTPHASTAHEPMLLTRPRLSSLGAARPANICIPIMSLRPYTTSHLSAHRWGYGPPGLLP